ncbi:hypothetical protein PAPYR_9144 [Paratrimastix pyriformis]|uniref:Uncharacterized protein n=1 Tax=Paratrimastix pyriformis TaxID=342808 RepID=A0ABQ8U964_9EUKA|nr:hypothetical protein PAPYR_9144 [Paratrimastix pyriformis]
MNSIDWNQFHTPKKPLSIARVRSARTPKWAEGYQAINWSAPAPTPYRQGPDRPDRPSDDAASGAVEHKDKGTGAARPILTMMPSPPKPKAPAAAKPKKDREAPRQGGPGGQPGPPHEAKEAAEAKGSDDAPRRTPGRGTGTSTRPQWRSPSSSDEGGRAPEPKAERKRARPTDPDDFSPEAARQVLQSVVDLVNAYLARHPPPPTPLAK